MERLKTPLLHFTHLHAKGFRLGENIHWRWASRRTPSTSLTVKNLKKSPRCCVDADRRVTIRYIIERQRFKNPFERGLYTLGTENVNRRAKEKTSRHFAGGSRKVPSGSGKFFVTLLTMMKPGLTIWILKWNNIPWLENELHYRSWIKFKVSKSTGEVMASLLRRLKRGDQTKELGNRTNGELTVFKLIEVMLEKQ